MEPEKVSISPKDTAAAGDAIAAAAMIRATEAVERIDLLLVSADRRKRKPGCDLPTRQYDKPTMPRRQEQILAARSIPTSNLPERRQ
jgi:hypothetical protein